MLRVQRPALLYFLLSLCLALLFVTAQGQEPPKLPFKLKETIPVAGERLGAMVVPLKCDADGNLYVLGYLAARPLAAPVLKISPDGKRLTRFAPNSAPGFDQAASFSFAVGLRGEVYFFGEKKGGELDILAFDSDGKYSSTIKLEPKFSPMQLAAFSSGEFLVSGTKIPEKRNETFTAILDRAGRLVKELKLPGDSEPEAVNSAEKDAEKEDLALNPAVSLGTAVTGDDGNIYLLRNASPPRVYVISAAGTVIRRLLIAPPSPKFSASTIKEAGGKLVVQFGETDAEGNALENVFSIADAETGETSIQYVSTAQLGGAFACYTPNGLTFLGETDRGQLAIMRTMPP